VVVEAVGLGSVRVGLATRRVSKRGPIIKQLRTGNQHTSARNQRGTTYRSVVLVHEIIRLYHGFVSCGIPHLEHLRIEELFKWVDWDVCEVDHWLSLSVEGHQSAPGNVVVVELAIGDNVLSRVGRNKECEL